tara:strand:+ start:905 stop:1219 length:315 start_codon:yes stop_codon:yes gene_type:complete
MASKEIDRWLKAEIEKVPEKLIKFRDTKLESKMVYYTGNWQTDVMANLTQRQSEKLFNKMQKIRDEGGLLFFQKRMKPIKIGATEYDDAEVIQGYSYIVMRGAK